MGAKRGENAVKSGQLNSAKGIAGSGRPRMTAQEKALKKAERAVTKEFTEELQKLSRKILRVYKTGLTLALKSRTAITADLKEIVITPGPQEIAVALKAADSISNRVHGMPKKSVELTGEDGGPIETETNYNLEGLNIADLKELRRLKQLVAKPPGN